MAVLTHQKNNAIHGPKPYKFIGKLVIHGPKPYELISKMAPLGPKLVFAPSEQFEYQ